MDLIKNWDEIRLHFKKSFRSNLHVAIASVNADQQPTTTPIGSFFLNKDQTGFYFEKFTRKLPQNAAINKKVCVLAVNSNKWFWVKSIFKGQFSDPPAIRLYGELGERRKATALEIRALQRRVRATSRLKGHRELWEDLTMIRMIHFTKAENMKIGKMTKTV